MKNILTISLLLTCGLCFGQKQGNIWYFAGNNGIDFNSGSPVLLTNGQIAMGGVEGTATISDSSGNLLFYATAENIWNRNHQLMLNGTGLMGHVSATQGVFIAPLPGTDSLFYVFTLDDMHSCFQKGLRYSIVDMCLDNGLGGVVNSYKNILLLDTAGEKLAGTFHSNGTDIWIVIHRYFSDAFYAYLLTANGITDTVISHIGSYHPADSTTDCYQAIGQMKISPDGSKLALVNANAPINSIAELFNFDNTTGLVSNAINLQPGSSFLYYGVSFSPDNSKLYVSKSFPYQLYQYDLSSGTSSVIVASKTSVYTSNTPIIGLQLAPDGKLYVNESDYLGIVSNPNNSGLSCNYVSHGFNLFSALPFSLPSFIDSYNYKNGVPCDTAKVPIDTPKVSLKMNFILPNAFTPNGDGKNDKFYPVLQQGVSMIAFRIYNRWGQLMFDNVDLGWDGKFNGFDQPSGSYYYYAIIKIDDLNSVEESETVNSSGAFSLLR